MLNIYELEKRWLHYKLKSFIPYLLILSSVIIVITVGVVLLTTTEKSSANVLQTQLIKPVQKSLSEPLIVTKSTVNIHVKKQNKISLVTQLKPSLNFIKKIENSAHLVYEESAKKQKIRNIEPKKTVIEEVILKKDFPLSKHKFHSSIKIKRQNTQNDINDIIKRFQQNNKPALSLFVAKKQYELKNYNQAYNYALITNKIDNNIDDSWIIFAKSLVKLGKKKEAITTLKKYIQNSQSNNAQILLNAILLGEFR